MRVKCPTSTIRRLSPLFRACKVIFGVSIIDRTLDCGIFNMRRVCVCSCVHTGDEGRGVGVGGVIVSSLVRLFRVQELCFCGREATVNHAYTLITVCP